MAISRQARITLLLCIDILFFLVELIAGYAVGSLALVADSFHMLNDILSLIVALYAIKLTGQKAEEINPKYSYGWHRAEILAALINGVFLLALCFSIFMEAMERFFSTPEISNPKLVVIVGSFGLASNIFGLFLFHEHGHSHSHGHGDAKKKSKTKARKDDKMSRTGAPEIGVTGETSSTSGSITPSDEEEQRGRSRERESSLFGYPAATRALVIQEAQELQRNRSPSISRSASNNISTSFRQEFTHRSFNSITSDNVFSPTLDERPTSESTPLLNNGRQRRRSQNTLADLPIPHEHDEHDDHAEHAEHADHGATSGHSHGHGHGHGSMNMQGILLHVLGDALGNVGVIATGLIFWFSTLSWKFYFDPIISLVITCIIFSSALPLVKSASYILLQGVPTGISLEEVDRAIRDVEGVQDVHELHIWQLSETKVVASVHVLASEKRDFMSVALEIRRALHERGIHSSTIQPEYHHPSGGSNAPNSAPCCLVTCPPNQTDCNPMEHACCPRPPASV